MNRRIAFGAMALYVIATGCDKKDQDAAIEQSRVVVNRATDFANGAWKSACAQASKLSEDSGKPAIEAAQSKLEAVRDKMLHIKAPSSLDDLKLDSVRDQIDRLQAALNVQKLKSEMDAKVDEAMQTKANAEKSIQDVRNKLAEADSQYQDLQKKLQRAQDVYDSASEKAKQVTQKLQNL